MRVPTSLFACSLAFVPLVPALNGCVDATSTRIGPPATAFDRPRVEPDRVAIYLEEDQVPGAYQEVGLLHVTGSESWSSESELYRKLQEEAGRLGANALILEPGREPSTREKIAARRLNLDMGREARAVAIYVQVDEEHGAPSEEPSSESITARQAPYRLDLEKEAPVFASGIEPSGTGQIKAVLPDGSARYLSSSKVLSIRDRDGRDWTKWVLEERRRLPRVTTSF